MGTPARSRATLAGAVLLLILTLLSTLLLAPGTARAGTGWDDDGPGSGGGSSGGGNYLDGDWKCGQQIGGIPGAGYLKRDGKYRLYYAAPYVKCDGSDPKNRFTMSNQRGYCPTGFEVYRFYGQEGKQPTAVTRSRLNLPSWCGKPAGDDSPYSFPAQTSWDDTPGTAPGSPDYIYKGTNFHMKDNGLTPTTYGTRDTGKLTPTAPTIVKGKCATVSRKNPVWEKWASLTERQKIGYRAILGQVYWKASKNGKWVASGRAAAGLRTGAGYRTNWSPTKTANEGVAPPKDRNGQYFYFTSFTFDQRNCSTPFNFAKVVDDATGKIEGNYKPVYGTCYVPLIRLTQEFRDPSTGKKHLAFPELERGQGERISTYYRNDRGNAPAADQNRWRKILKDDYLKRAPKGTAWPLNSKGAQLLPAQSHPGERSTARLVDAVMYDKQAAAQDFSKYAKCMLGDAVTLSGLSSSATAVQATAQIDVVGDQVLKSGGALYKATFDISRPKLMCGASECKPSQATIKSASYDLTITGLNGYTECAGSGTAGCDYKVLTKKTGNANTPGQVVIEFYNATAPAERIAVKVTNPKVTYEYHTAYEGVSVEGVDPETGQKFVVKTGQVNGTGSATITPKVAYQSCMGGAINTGCSVMGAVDVPVTNRK
jgi:hypothetical protein